MKRTTAHNKPLHLTAIPLRFIAAGELGRYFTFRRHDGLFIDHRIRELPGQ